MDAQSLQSAEDVRSAIVSRACKPAHFRQALLDVPTRDRDAWVDAVLGMGEVLEDGPELPQGCVPYLPCGVDALIRLADRVPIGPRDVFVDIGSGMGRAAVFMHLLTGARVVGVEVQSAHVRAARDLVTRMGLADVRFVQGDAADIPAACKTGTVFFLYCPFGTMRLVRFLGHLQPIACARPISVGLVDLPLPPCTWLTRVGADDGDLAIYRSRALVS